MKLEKIIPLITLSMLTTFTPYKKIEKNKTLLVKLDNFEIPQFPKATFYNKTDTFYFQGDFSGQINYKIPSDNYKILITPGKDPLTNKSGDYFNSFHINKNISNKTKNLEEISPTKK